MAAGGGWRGVVDGFAAHRPLTGAAGLAHEERMIWGLIIDYVKYPLAERLQLITEFLPAIDNWAICDNFCCNSKWADKLDAEECDELWEYIISLLHSGKEWSIRVGAVLAMCHYLGPQDMARTFEAIDGLGLREGEPYYVRMGIAWLLATALAKDAAATRGFARSCRLPSDILKLYVRKARESRLTRTTPAL